MGYFVSVALLLYALVLHYRRKTWVQPDTLFCYEWGVISLLSSMHLYTMYETTIKTWGIILVGTVSFCVGTFLGGRIKSFSSTYIEQNEKRQIVLFTNNMFWTIAIISLVVSLPEFIQSFILMSRGVSLGDIRMASYGLIEINNYSFKSGAFYQVYSLFRSVIRLMVVAVAIESFVYDVNNGYKKFIMAVFTELLISFTSGGRFAIAYLIIELIVAFGIYKNYGKRVEYNISTKTAKWIKVLTVSLIAIILVITLVRGAAISELVIKFYRYICGNIKFFDLHRKEVDDNGFMAYGYASMYGMWNTVLPVFHKFDFSYPERFLETIKYILGTQTFLQIGSNMATNAFITPYYYLYLDFRMLGVVGGMLIFGMISGGIFKKAIVSMQPGYIALYLIISQMIFKTLQIYPFTSDSYFFGIIIISLLIKMKKRKYY